jgi:hypothetical protein
VVSVLPQAGAKRSVADFKSRRSRWGDGQCYEGEKGLQAACVGGSR